VKAIVYKRYGGPEVLELVELPEPKVGQSSVMVQVKAAGLNPADVGIQAGAGDSIIDAWFPVIPGWDVAGVVMATGPGVTEFRRGDEVIGFVYEGILRHGAYAERIAAAVHYFVRKPRNATWAQATNARGVLNHSTKMDPDVRYPPYGRKKPPSGIAVSS